MSYGIDCLCDNSSVKGTGTYIRRFEVETTLDVAQASLAITAKSTNQFQQTRLITSPPDKHHSLRL